MTRLKSSLRVWIVWFQVAQVVAHTLNIALELVSVKPSNNLTAPNGMVSGGSMTSDACAYVRIQLAYLFKGMINCIDFVLFMLVSLLMELKKSIMIFSWVQTFTLTIQRLTKLMIQVFVQLLVLIISIIHSVHTISVIINSCREIKLNAKHCKLRLTYNFLWSQKSSLLSELH